MNVIRKERPLFRIFHNLPVRVCLSHKNDGCMTLRPDDPHAAENRRRFLDRFEIQPGSVVSAGIAYGARVQGVGYANRGAVIPGVDGLSTLHLKLPLSVTVCDCLPIYFYAGRRGMVGIAHAGWQPITKGIISEMMQHFAIAGIRPREVLVAIGPGIDPCHFEVKKDVAILFREWGSDVVLQRRGAFFIDLKSVVYRQLLGEGIPRTNIEVHPECTFCGTEKYFSYRRDKPEKPIPMLALIERLS